MYCVFLVPLINLSNSEIPMDQKRKLTGTPSLPKIKFPNYLGITQTIKSQVLFEKYLAGVGTVDYMEKFFSATTFELANRAARHELPYRYHELVTKWDTMFRNHYGDRDFDRRVAESMRRTGSIQSPTNNNSKKPRTSPWCKDFNTDEGCKNPQADGGCTDSDEKDNRHGCNARLQGGQLCNSSRHNKLSH